MAFTAKQNRAWRIEIQATNKTWFADHVLPVTSDPVKADERIAELRRQGFKARGRMTDSVESER